MQNKTSWDQGITVDSVQKFVETTCRYRDLWIGDGEYFDPWFRGQTRASKVLEPNIFRYRLLDSEDEIRAEFQRRAPQYISELAPGDYWGWYFLMQHFGAPTRLLDWTDSALVALFFALNSDSMDPQDDEDAVVWMLDPWWLNNRVYPNEALLSHTSARAGRYLAQPYTNIDGSDRTRVEPEYPVAIDPPFIARRVAAQRSHFTIFGWARDALTRLGNEPGSHLVKLVLAKEALTQMRSDLLTLGITDTSVYPDLRGLAFELIRYHFRSEPSDGPANIEIVPRRRRYSQGSRPQY